MFCYFSYQQDQFTPDATRVKLVASGPSDRACHFIWFAIHRAAPQPTVLSFLKQWPNDLDQGSATCGSRATCGSLNPQLWLLLEVNKYLFLGTLFGITESFGPDGSFAAPVGFRVVTNGLIGLFKCKRLPTPGLDNTDVLQRSLPSYKLNLF